MSPGGLGGKTSSPWVFQRIGIHRHLVVPWGGHLLRKRGKATHFPSAGLINMGIPTENRGRAGILLGRKKLPSSPWLGAHSLPFNFCRSVERRPSAHKAQPLISLCPNNGGGLRELETAQAQQREAMVGRRRKVLESLLQPNQSPSLRSKGKEPYHPMGCSSRWPELRPGPSRTVLHPFNLSLVRLGCP